MMIDLNMVDVMGWVLEMVGCCGLVMDSWWVKWGIDFLVRE